MDEFVEILNTPTMTLGSSGLEVLSFAHVGAPNSW